MVKTFTRLAIAFLCVFSLQLTAQTNDETDGLDYFFFKTTGVDSVITEVFDSVSFKMVPVDLEKYSYNALCNISRINGKEWNVAQKRWVDVGQEVYNYDAQNRLANKQIRPVNNGIARDSARFVYAYNGSETLLANQTKQLLLSGTWENEEFQEFTYTPTRKIATQVVKEWGGSAWINDTRTTNTFDAQNRLITKVNEESPNGTTWVNYERNTYAYNAQNRLLSIRVQRWIADSTKWDESTSPAPVDVSADGRKISSEIDFFGLFIKAEYVISPTRFLDTFNIYFGNLAFPYVLVARERYIYTPNCTRTATNDLAFLPNAVTLSPNPATEALTIRFNDKLEGENFAATITNTAGQIVDKFSWTGTSDQQKDIHQLPNGLYFLSIRGEKGQTVQKFVVQR
jgi:Secretion system C-terminal sorting domain